MKALFVKVCRQVGCQFTYFFVVMMCLWTVDVSMTCMNFQNCVLTNGWSGYHDPTLMYHLALYIIIVATMIEVLTVSYNAIQKLSK